ncbi:MAG: 50S ribosomal protein L22 [Candidatus Caenarcaniphilales bacterium]|nr:50S ribosomal protein L22 [Candidatus Caenarcaniphilales bacterium]
MEKVTVKARLGFIRQTARKLRRTVNLIRNMKAGEALTTLRFLPYAAATPVKKLLMSAMANAKANHGIENPEELHISQFLVDDKSILKRYRARARGRAFSIYKRCSQMNIVLSDMTPAEYGSYVWETSPRNKKNWKKENKELSK